ncbi:uncharacterized protein PHACADRAFT_163663 [Phanerochaete carnosa HHB-10118-sp]|uniref:Uncharacterized protein n=1 Tax=Phanerochaete carnosa (strain HHB-10118-sp) TaxID=650164 RepID=K5UTU1_PHACS|nr:uncharacterized protein PHACADRAFT_163663 [Phanerochaete carnosa HHB-10118-sp]EKM53366.1 hypothetical protein PHACADRAFT_163663 [Phanerochaete carnosa HHB-10118-sp]
MLRFLPPWIRARTSRGSVRLALIIGGANPGYMSIMGHLHTCGFGWVLLDSHDWSCTRGRRKSAAGVVHEGRATCSSLPSATEVYSVSRAHKNSADSKPADPSVQFTSEKEGRSVSTCPKIMDSDEQLNGVIALARVSK